METINKQSITIDFKKSTMIQLPHFIQEDSNVLEFVIKDNGVDADMSNVGRIVVNFLRADKKVISRLLEAVGNIVTYEMGIEEQRVGGYGEVEINFFSSDDIQRISTNRFKVYLSPSIGTSEIYENDEDYHLLKKLFIEVENVKNSIDEIEQTALGNEQSRVDAENARAAAETNRQSNEQIRETNEADRMSNEDERKVNELTRQSNEDARQANESTRESNESARQAASTTAVNNAEAATTNANIAAENANAKATELETRVDAAIGSTTDSAEIIDARLGVDGTNHPVLKNRLDKMEGQLVEADRQTATLKHGLNILRSDQPSPLKVEFYGNTLVNLGASTLQSGKYYVSPDKKIKVKFADGSTYQNKFVGQSEKPAIIRIANFEGKIANSTIENPHRVFNYGSKTSLDNPSTYPTETTSISQIIKLDGSTLSANTSASGGIAQQLFSFNLIEEVERRVGKIPKTTVADKVQWLKDNLARLYVSWHGFGSGVGGNKATLTYWQQSSWGSSGIGTHYNSTVSKTIVILTTFGSRIDENGFVHFLAHAEPSDGTTPSTINTDYVELEIELKPTANFTNPKFPLYETSQSTYDKIGVSLTDADVERMFPYIDSVQSVKNPVIRVSGKNLINQQTLEIGGLSGTNGATTAETTRIRTDFMEVVRNTDYVYSSEATVNEVLAYFYDSNKNFLSYSVIHSTAFSFKTPTNAKFARLRIGGSSTVGEELLKQNHQLELGGTPTPFVPYNNSYLYAETVLAGLPNSDKKDILRKNEALNRWEVQRWIERDVVLDDSLNWSASAYEGEGFRRVYTTSLKLPAYTPHLIVKHDGKFVKDLYTHVNTSGDESYINSSGDLYITIYDEDSEGYDLTTPSEIKRYFADKNYFLSYERSTPVIEVEGIDFPYVEGDLAISGDAQVEVSEGVIVREKVNPINAASYYYVNRVGVEGSLLKHKVGKIIGFYENGEQVKYASSPESGWVVSSPDAYGNQRLAIHESLIDPTATYTVTYEVLDKHAITTNINEVKATYQQSMKSSFGRVVEKQADIATDQSILKRQMLNVLVRLDALEGV